MEDLRQVPFLDEEHTTCVGMTIATTEVELVHQVLKKNVDLLAWTTSDIPGVSLDIITHKLLVYKEMCPVAQKKPKLLPHKC